jgi:hypothetical protein
VKQQLCCVSPNVSKCSSNRYSWSYFLRGGDKRLYIRSKLERFRSIPSSHLHFVHVITVIILYFGTVSTSKPPYSCFQLQTLRILHASMQVAIRDFLPLELALSSFTLPLIHMSPLTLSTFHVIPRDPLSHSNPLLQVSFQLSIRPIMIIICILLCLLRRLIEMPRQQSSNESKNRHHNHGDDYEDNLPTLCYFSLVWIRHIIAGSVESPAS